MAVAVVVVDTEQILAARHWEDIAGQNLASTSGDMTDSLLEGLQSYQRIVGEIDSQLAAH